MAGHSLSPGPHRRAELPPGPRGPASGLRLHGAFGLGCFSETKGTPEKMGNNGKGPEAGKFWEANHKQGCLRGLQKSSRGLAPSHLLPVPEPKPHSGQRPNRSLQTPLPRGGELEAPACWPPRPGAESRQVARASGKELGATSEGRWLPPWEAGQGPSCCCLCEHPLLSGEGWNFPILL